MTSSSQILGIDRQAKSPGKPQARRILRRLQALEKLPKRDQETVLRTIDAFLAKAS